MTESAGGGRDRMAMGQKTWHPIDSAPADKIVETCINDADGMRNVADLCRIGRIWFLADASMYVYYTPTHWRPVVGK